MTWPTEKKVAYRFNIEAMLQLAPTYGTMTS